MSQYEVKDIENDINEIIKKSIGEYLLFGKEETCLPKTFLNYINDIENLKIRNDDVFVASFMKAGTTWAQEMVWLIKNKLDFKGAQAYIQQRFPMLELTPIIQHVNYLKELKLPWVTDSVEYVKQLSGNRYIKTHLPFSLLPKEITTGLKTPKIIYVMRNPKDVFISSYYYGKLVLNWTASFDDLAKVFLANKVLYGGYWENLFSYYNNRHLSNLLIIKYEEMKEDLESVIRQVCTFLGQDQFTTEEMKSLCAHLSFDRMRNNDSVNQQNFISLKKQHEPQLQGEFMRSGQIGQYKEEMSAQMIAAFDEWIKEKIANTGFDEDYAYNK